MKPSTTTHAAAALALTAALLLSACGGGGSSPAPQPSVTATPTPTPTTNPQAFTCPASGTLGTGSIARTSGEALTRRMDRAPQNVAVTTPQMTKVAVDYSRSTLAANLPQVAAREQAIGAALVRSFDYGSLSMTQRIISVPTSSLARAESLLRTQAGVLSVAVTGERRYKLTSTNPYWPNDPFFRGFTALQNQSAGNPAVNTFEVAPYAEASAAPGEWDMHAIGLEHAFGYVNGGTGIGATANALGSSSIKIAIIDTGVDASHPELTSKINHEACFITSAIAPYPLSTGNFSTDYLGHGTDVAGIAAEAGDNGLGFAGAGGKALIYAYRVFPTPDDNCAIEGTLDVQCSSDTSDIASAIDDAVTQGVNIISMSLGGGSCSGGVDSDPAERAAVANALSHNIIVVAAAGNAGTGTVDAPACITNVIAVGATGLDDGVATGTSGYTRTVTGASAANPIEYVASYSQYGSPNTLHSAGSWGIVAPGGDPATSETTGTPDDLHWIENIWTSTPYQSSPSDTAFTGNCNGDYPLETGAADCRTLIAGTSMATPHVAGAAALILAVNPSYGTPAAMKQLLCQTADDLGDTHQGCGRLNVYRAMAVALGDTPLP